MKKLFCLLAIFTFAFVLVACGDNNQNIDPNQGGKEDPKQEEKKVNVKINDEVNIKLGEQLELSYEIENIEIEEQDMLVVLYNEEIFSAENDFYANKFNINGLKCGKGEIEILIGDYSKVVKVVVSASPEDIAVTFANSKFALKDNAQSLFTEVQENSVTKAGFVYQSSDETVATVNGNGEIMTLKEGKTTITVASKLDSSIKITTEVEVYFDAFSLFDEFNIDEVLYQNVQTFGSDVKEQMVKGSVSLYTPMPLNLIEKIVPITNNSPYAGMTATEELLTKVEAENKYMRSGILHTETTKITYHDTGNNSEGANALMHANYLVGDANLSSRARSWHYTVDETNVYHHIPDNEVTWQGDNYLAYSTSIGIETCVNYKSELEVTWHRTAKLMASLIKKYNMTIDDVVQHYDWSGKNCPQTLRMNNLYSYAIDMIKAELSVLNLLDGYKIEYTSLNPDLLNDYGHVINMPEVATRVGYIVTLTNPEGVKQSKTYYSTIPGLDGSKEDSRNYTNVDLFHNAIATMTKDNITEVIAIYKSLTDEEKKLAFGVNYFIQKISSLKENKQMDLSIEEVCVSDFYRYKYIELKNNSKGIVNLGVYSIRYTDSTGAAKTVKLKAKQVTAGTTYLCFAGINNENVIDEVIYPDLSLDFDLGATGKIELLKNDEVVDSVEYTKDVTRISKTGSNDDFLDLYPSPLNSKGEVLALRENTSYKVIDTEAAILLIPSTVTKDDGALIDAAYELYNSLSSAEKKKVRNFTNLKNLKAQYDALQ